MSLPAPVSLQEITAPTEEQEQELTLDQLLKVVPKRAKTLISQQVVDTINNTARDSEIAGTYRENILSYASVLQDGKFKLGAYLNAVKYVSYKLMGDSNDRAYAKTFPDRYQHMLDVGYTATNISAKVAGYHKTALVSKILEQSIIPSWILNQDLYQQALNTQADLMLNARSEKVRMEAANSLLVQLKMPEAAKVEIDVAVKEDDSISELRKSTLELVAMQRKMIQAGLNTAEDMAKQKIINVEVERIN